MDNHNNTSEEATSAQGTRSAADQASELEVIRRMTMRYRGSHLGVTEGKKKSQLPRLESNDGRCCMGRNNRCYEPLGGIEEEGLRRLRRARHVEGSGDGRWIVGDYSGKMWMGSCREGNDSGWAVTFDHAVGMMLVMMTIEEGDSFWTAAVGRRGWGQRQAGSPRS
ncbi:hypothetical protein BHM03_00040360 [Ensete ventricosum]|nr:hypothetical protein BHM03_00040360 [Ensete ventricosum]